MGHFLQHLADLITVNWFPGKSWSASFGRLSIPGAVISANSRRGNYVADAVDAVFSHTEVKLLL